MNIAKVTLISKVQMKSCDTHNITNWQSSYLEKLKDKNWLTNEIAFTQSTSRAESHKCTFNLYKFNSTPGENK